MIKLAAVFMCELWVGGFLAMWLFPNGLGPVSTKFTLGDLMVTPAISLGLAWLFRKAAGIGS